MEIWIGTTNQGKLKEIKTLLPSHFEVKSLQDIRSYTPPAETGKTFEDNARIKAKSLKAVKPNVWILAEDSGLEVKGLNNMPGVFSARYAGDNARDVENCAKVLKMLSIRSPLQREAQLQCVMIAYSPDGNEHKFEGTMKGQIAKDMRGKNGFGYDSVFIPEGSDKTLAELGDAEKNKISHRAHALKEFLKLITQ